MAESATSVGSLTFLGLFAMFSLSPRFTFTHPGEYCANAPRKLEADPMPHAGRKNATLPPACPLHPGTSYSLVGADEIPASTTILIIVNSPHAQGLTVSRISCSS